MKVTFKRAENVDLSTVFPIINESEYKILSGIEISISDRDWKTVESQGYYEVAGYQISKDLMIPNAQETVSPIQELVQKKISEKFIHSDKLVDIVFTGFESKKNILLWGKGGHGKSEMITEIMKILLEEGKLKSMPFVQACGDGLTEEKLYGGMNIKKYKEEGVIEYLPENSFMNHPVVIFEEIFDAPPSVLLSLKDIMTSGYFRQGNEIFKCKTKVFIALTNRSKEEFADQDDSLKALAERFPLTLNVKWPSYNRTDFNKLFKKVLGKEVFKQNEERLRELSHICSMNNKDGDRFISPRTAVVAGQIYIKNRNLSYISDIDPDIISKYKKEKYMEKNIGIQKEALEKMKLYAKQNALLSSNHASDNQDSVNSLTTEIEAIEREFLANKSESNQTLKDVSLSLLEEKSNKIKFLLGMLNAQNPIESLYDKFTSFNKKLNESLKEVEALKTSGTATKSSFGEPQQDEGAVSQNIPF